MRQSIVMACFAVTLSLGLAACGDGDKPTREEAIVGWQMIIEEQFSGLGYTEDDYQILGLSDERLNAYYECFVDGIYDDVSASTLRGLASGDSDSSVAEDDQPVIEAANASCLAEAGF